MKIIIRVLIFCFVFLCFSSIAYSQTYNGCPSCLVNLPVMAGHGAASSTDQRRVINVRIDETWGTNTPASLWNATCAGQPGAGCSNATGPSAINMWNSVGTYYFFQLNQVNNGSTDIQITRDATWSPDKGCAETESPIEDPISGTSPSTSLRIIHLPPGSENWSQQQLACVLAHEIGHGIGLVDVFGGCDSSIMNQGKSKDCSQGCDKTEISSLDVQAANKQAGDRAHCGSQAAVSRQNFGGGLSDPYPYRYNPTCYYYYDAVDYYHYCECAESGCQCSSGSYRGVMYVGTVYYLTDVICL